MVLRILYSNRGRIPSPRVAWYSVPFYILSPYCKTHVDTRIPFYRSSSHSWIFLGSPIFIGSYVHIFIFLGTSWDLGTLVERWSPPKYLKIPQNDKGTWLDCLWGLASCHPLQVMIGHWRDIFPSPSMIRTALESSRIEELIFAVYLASNFGGETWPRGPLRLVN